MLKGDRRANPRRRRRWFLTQAAAGPTVPGSGLWNVDLWGKGLWGKGLWGP